MIVINSDTRFYILCPQNFTTGGVETLHQLSFKLRALGIKAYMVYFPETKEPVIPEQYIQKYSPAFVDVVDDEENNVLIIPEIYIDHSLDKYTKIKRVIWWLSVDNYLVQTLARKAPDLRFVKMRNFYNLVQSAHTNAFLVRHGVTVHGYMSGYISPAFIEEKIDRPKSDIVLYNPKKGFEFTSKLLKAAPDINWMPLQNMNPMEVKEAFLSAKVYIDFGNHPGRDRFPREAAVTRCCIITGTRGSAAFYEDLPIPNEFKFKEAASDAGDIVEKIKTCLAGYEKQIHHFHIFHETVKGEERKLETDIKTLFPIL